MASPPVLAVDIGGTKIDVGLVGDDGRTERRARAATPQGPAEEVWAAVAGLVDEVGTGGATACGIGCSGPMDPVAGTVSPLNIPGWQAFPLRDRMAGLTGLPVALDNDAKALALAEGRFGAARGVTDYVSMVVSSGVGGGIVLGGRLLDGASGNAGHIGHVVVEPDGRPCPCGGLGCLEAEASGLSIQAVTGAPPAAAGPDVVVRVGRAVGRAVASVANLLDLRLAAVAGSVALGYGAPFFAAAREEIALRCRLAYSRACRIVPSGLGAEGPLVGAACLAWRR